MVGTAQRKAWNEAMRSAAGVSALRPATQRRSDRRKKQDRRDKARKVESVEHNVEYRAAQWMDALEEVDPSGLVGEEDEEYDVLDEIDDDRRGGKRKRGGGRKGASKSKVGVLPKRFKPRSLATILMEDANREDGSAREFIDIESRLSQKQQLPPRKFCPVTGLFGIYTEPKSGISYANLKALEQIRERAPPWMTLGGTPSYWETVKSIRDEE